MKCDIGNSLFIDYILTKSILTKPAIYTGFPIAVFQGTRGHILVQYILYIYLFIQSPNNPIPGVQLLTVGSGLTRIAQLL